jgi:hypothetical protein
MDRLQKEIEELNNEISTKSTVDQPNQKELDVVC